MTPKITGIHHVALKAFGSQEYEKTVSFYCDILKLPVVRVWGAAGSRGTMLDTGAGLLEIFENGTDRPAQGPLRHIAFAVEDVDACTEAVRRHGYPITVEPNDIVIESEPPYPARIAFCIGPVGEEIEFFKVR